MIRTDITHTELGAVWYLVGVRASAKLYVQVARTGRKVWAYDLGGGVLRRAYKYPSLKALRARGEAVPVGEWTRLDNVGLKVRDA